MKLELLSADTIMNKLTKQIIIILLLAPFISGCGLVFRVVLGIDIKPNWNSDKEITKQAKRYHIPSEYNLVLDTVTYFKGLKAIYKDRLSQLDSSENDSLVRLKLKQVYKDDGQPVQFRMFDKNGNEFFKLVNCYVDPPIPMNWNVNGCFDTFPPKIDVESLNSHSFNLAFLLANSTLLNHHKITLNELPKTDYYAVITWNSYFKRPSKKLIKMVRKKIQKTHESVTLIYINNQNALLWDEMDSATKEKVKMYYEKK